ncbi:MAG: hypothetical protein F6J97_08195 [Leptolyngbya sp. SIO4C1]|nr:hypothetical protein [Leptolyngbya sp. SIO4C1]
MTNGPTEQPLSNDELRQLVASNARAIAAMQPKIDANAEAIAELRQATASTSQAVSTLGAEIAAGFDRSRADLDATTADVISMIGSIGEEISETSRQVQVLIEEGRADRITAQRQREQAEADRQANDREHSAFREQFQVLLAEISRIWQRLSA